MEVDEINAYRELLYSAQTIPKGDKEAVREWYESEEDCLDIGLITSEMREVLMETVIEFQTEK